MDGRPVDPIAFGLGDRSGLSSAFAFSPLILCMTRLGDGRLVDVNQAFLRATGYARDELIGRRMEDLGLWIDPDIRARGLAALREGRGVRDTEARFRAKHGDEIVAILAAETVTIDGDACILTAAMDITDRVRAENALRESEQRFLGAFHANPLPMTITSLPEGRHLEVNDAAVRHGGYAREELLGRTKLELGFWVAPEQRQRMLSALGEHGRVRDLEVTFRTKGGEERDLLVNSEVISFSGRPAVLSVSLDITERKALEAENRARRREAEELARALASANRAKDEFFAMLGHELRNPLGAITNAVAVLDHVATDRRAPGDRGDRPSDVAPDAAGGRLARRGARDLGEDRPQARTGRRAALAGRCLDALAQAGRTRGLEVTLGGVPVGVEADPTRLEQMLNNLLDNAVKCTPPGGRIHVVAQREGDHAVLRVRDTGRGMREELRARVFDLFVQDAQGIDRPSGGLGVGLALVKRLVELHGGSVEASSDGPDAGSEFVVRLPALAADAVGAGAVAASPRPAARRRVLVVEDGADSRETLRMFLELEGHEVEVCPDGPSGLERLRAFQPEIALIDLGLPGLDGYALAQLARHDPRTRDVRLAALTGYGRSEDCERALAAGFDAHLTKPVSPDLLRRFLAAR